MPEDIFRFKKFGIAQNELVHRVGTDGVLLGAWVSVDGVSRILDVGTGTGLIAIMIAQRSESSSVVAIEPDLTAYEMAFKNANQSPYSKMIEVHHSSLQNFQSREQFDLIICNPPFFTNSLKPSTKLRTRQRHTDDLNLEHILTAVTKLLHPTGRLALILPVQESKVIINQGQNFGLTVSRQCDVYPKEKKTVERCLLELSYHSSRLEKSALTLMTPLGEWTEEYKHLTQDFYLKF